MKYRIKSKRDWPNNGRGFYKRGHWINRGFVVTDGGIVNVMPGATWFETIGEAMDALEILLIVDGDAKAFWQGMRADKVST